MSGVYEQELLLGSEHVDCFRRLRTSTMLRLFQTISIRHTEQLGMGRDKTLDKGLLWVIARQRVEIAHMPEYDERIVLRSWPGETMHVLFPRYYEIAAADGSTLVSGSAVWLLMDAEGRGTVFPDEHGIEIEGVETGREMPYMTKIAPIEAAGHAVFTVPYSYVDINGHMNNARYFDLVEDHIPAAREGRPLRALQAEYHAEAPLGTALSLDWGEQDGRYYACGSGEKLCFKMELVYG